MTEVPLSSCYRLLGHGPVLLVSTRGLLHPNVAPIAWHSPFDRDPPQFLLTISSGHATFENLLREGELVLNVPGPDLASAVLAAGRVSAHEVPDKFSHLGLRALPSARVSAPRVEGCLAWIECRLVDESLARSQEIVRVEAVRAETVEGAWSEGFLDIERFPTLHHLGGSRLGVLRSLLPS
jgi:flavin reductase (DIM6/NTAB) family NADH-FMN oxidoreductase RutF